MRLTQNEVSQLIELTALLHVPSPESESDFRSLFLAQLRRLVAFEFAGCHFIERSDRRIHACYEPLKVPQPSVHKDFWKIVERHPLNQALFTQHSQVWRISDFESRTQFQESELYEVLYQPLGVDCEMAVSVPDASRPGWELLVTLHRARQDFTDRDRSILKLMVPELARRQQVDPLHRCIRELHRKPQVDPQYFHNHVERSTPWKLTPRESEVVYWLSEGKSNLEIGSILGISPRTAETHALRAYPKMGVENRFGAMNAVHRLLRPFADGA